LNRRWTQTDADRKDFYLHGTRFKPGNPFGDRRGANQLVPQGGSQKSKVLYIKAFACLKWLLYLRRAILE